MFGASQQVPHAGGSYAAGLSPPLAARAALKLNMSWHHHDLHFFLRLLAGIAALLPIIYEFCREQGDGPRPSPTALTKLRNRFRRRFTPGDVQRLEQRSHTRL